MPTLTLGIPVLFLTSVRCPVEYTHAQKFVGFLLFSVNFNSGIFGGRDLRVTPGSAWVQGAQSRQFQWA